MQTTTCRLVLLMSLALGAAPVFAEPVKALPLTPGFYVSSDTACADASNATLSLVRPTGINVAQVDCTISAIDQTGPTSFSVTDACVELSSGSALAAQATLYDIPDDKTYGYLDGTTVVSQSRFCPQKDLPEPWRSNDIGN